MVDRIHVCKLHHNTACREVDMDIILPDGQVIDPTRIREITPIRDLGLDSGSIDRSVLAFTIRMRGGQSIQVKEYYHFSDWADASKRLKVLRATIEARWQNSGASQSE